ncbi:MAG TPA: hypothetical protein VGR16_06670 [Thermomicrobiales bacterium]|nr:hypothetical protein [Thermomicrobiales bacterium]
MTSKREAQSNDPIAGLIALLDEPVVNVLRRLEGESFTTPQFIDVMLTDPAAAAAYQEAVRQWGETERTAKMVVHGQAIPAILRQSGLVEWLGFAHEEDDPYAVPAWWRLIDNP